VDNVEFFYPKPLESPARVTGRDFFFESAGFETSLLRAAAAFRWRMASFYGESVLYLAALIRFQE